MSDLKICKFARVCVCVVEGVQDVFNKKIDSHLHSVQCVFSRLGFMGGGKLYRETRETALLRGVIH